MDNSAPRQEIDRLIATGAAQEAARSLSQLWQQRLDPSVAGFVVSRFEKLRPCLPLVSSRLSLLRSFTVEPAVPLLRAAAYVAGIDLSVQIGGFNTYTQEILDPESDLYGFAPDTVIMALQTRDVAPDLWGCYPDLTPSETRAAVERVVDQVQGLIQAFRSRSCAHLILQTLDLPPLLRRGILDVQSEEGQGAAIRQVNRELLRLTRDYPGVYLLDYDALVAHQGRVRWYDERKWLTMRMPVAAENLIHLAHEWLRYLHPLTGKVCKALVTDLDNTLWGGVIGEEGIAGIQVGPEYPGAAYQGLQRAMLDLYQRGVLLAVCSKNNRADAMEALEAHPGMLLRPHHFAALRINWNDKVQNLREIAAELNIGLDALAFLDDNPVERERVRGELPEVQVIELPVDPMDYSPAVRGSMLFERLTIATEDRERGRYYAEQHQRDELRQSAASLEEFYCSLQQEVEIAPVQPGTLARVAQLTQKTNQFNLTTRRYSEQQIAALAASSNWSICAVRVKDRFGDNGLVGVAMTQDVDDACEIDCFLLSCRVIGRQVETALLAFLVQQAQLRGAMRLQGWFLPTKKNAPARDFYEKHGFRLVREEGSGSLWSLDLRTASMAPPEWIQLTVLDGGTA